MAKYRCKICGFVYDEAQGYTNDGIKPGVKWEDVPEDWLCPLCKASKEEFVLLSEDSDKSVGSEAEFAKFEDHKLLEMNSAELGVLFSGLAKACSKQYLGEESSAFTKLSEYFIGNSKTVDSSKIEEILPLVVENIEKDYPITMELAQKKKDRGAQRVCVWGEKATNMLRSILTRFESQKEAILENTRIYVCEACGFIYIGDELPDVCPVCSVPKSRIYEIGRS